MQRERDNTSLPSIMDDLCLEKIQSLILLLCVTVCFLLGFTDILNCGINIIDPKILTGVLIVTGTEYWLHVGWFAHIKQPCVDWPRVNWYTPIRRIYVYWSRVSYYALIRGLSAATFIASFFWNWMYLYQVACAERMATLTKLERYAKKSCEEDVGWLESLGDWLQGSATFRKDLCEEYYEALMVNPLLQVPPTKALALTVSDLLMEPLVHLGKAIGEFLTGLLVQIPGLYQLPVLILVAVIMVVFLYCASKVCVQVVASRKNQGTPQERLMLPAPQERLTLPAPPSPQLAIYSEEHFKQMFLFLQEQRPEYLEALQTS